MTWEEVERVAPNAIVLPRRSAIDRSGESFRTMRYDWYTGRPPVWSRTIAWAPQAACARTKLNGPM